MGVFGLLAGGLFLVAAGGAGGGLLELPAVADAFGLDTVPIGPMSLVLPPAPSPGRLLAVPCAVPPANPAIAAAAAAVRPPEDSAAAEDEELEP